MPIHPHFPPPIFFAPQPAKIALNNFSITIMNLVKSTFVVLIVLSLILAILTEKGKLQLTIQLS